jgi:hypothetical protein
VLSLLLSPLLHPERVPGSYFFCGYLSDEAWRYRTDEG